MTADGIVTDATAAEVGLQLFQLLTVGSIADIGIIDTARHVATFQPIAVSAFVGGHGDACRAHHLGQTTTGTAGHTLRRVDDRHLSVQQPVQRLLTTAHGQDQTVVAVCRQMVFADHGDLATCRLQAFGDSCHDGPVLLDRMG